MTDIKDTWEQQRAQENAARIQRRNDRIAIALEITAAMGDDWKFTPSTSDYVCDSFLGKLVHPSGRYSINLTVSSHPNLHWHISGNDGNGWNEYHANQIKPVGINVGFGKTAEQIAKDIRRRYLPAWEQYADMQIEYVGKVNAAKNKREATFATLVANLNDPRVKIERGRETGEITQLTIDLHGNFGGGWINIKPCGDEFTVEARSIDLATITAMLKTLKK